jgi:hypothetical protein
VALRRVVCDRAMCACVCDTLCVELSNQSALRLFAWFDSRCDEFGFGGGLFFASRNATNCTSDNRRETNQRARQKYITRQSHDSTENRPIDDDLFLRASLVAASLASAQVTPAGTAANASPCRRAARRASLRRAATPVCDSCIAGEIRNKRSQ